MNSWWQICSSLLSTTAIIWSTMVELLLSCYYVRIIHSYLKSATDTHLIDRSVFTIPDLTDYQSFGALLSRKFNWKGRNAKNMVNKKNWLIYLNDCNFRTRLEARRRDQQQLLPRIWDINDKWLERNGRVKCGSYIYFCPTFAATYPMHQYFELVETWKLNLIALFHVLISSYHGYS